MNYIDFLRIDVEDNLEGWSDPQKDLLIYSNL